MRIVNGEDTRFENRSLATATTRQKPHSVGVGGNYCLCANEHCARVHYVRFHQKRVMRIICPGTEYQQALALMSLPTVAEHHHNICTRTFKSIMSDPNHKLRKLLPVYPRTVFVCTQAIVASHPYRVRFLSSSRGR